ncbi:MAG: hypothetical protein D6759_07070, partial [Chloroflexi bacterium]
MVTALHMAHRHPLLIIATTDTDSLRQYLETLLAQRLAPKPIHHVNITPEYLDVLPSLARDVPADAAAISLSGLPELSSSERLAVYRYLNYRRELLD